MYTDEVILDALNPFIKKNWAKVSVNEFNHILKILDGKNFNNCDLTSLKCLQKIGENADELIEKALNYKKSINDKIGQIKTYNIDDFIEIVISAKSLKDEFKEMEEKGLESYYMEIEELNKKLELNKIKDLSLKERLKICLKYLTI